MKTIETIKGHLFALARREANQNAISLFDVKSLYDAAYADKAKARACLRSFKARLAKAEKLDLEYRYQLARDSRRLYGKAV